MGTYSVLLPWARRGPAISGLPASPISVCVLTRARVTSMPRISMIRAFSAVSVDDVEAIRGKRVLVVEDGPTLTHGEMRYGAGVVAARQHGAAEIVDPRKFAVGTLKATYAKYDIGDVLPAILGIA